MQRQDGVGASPRAPSRARRRLWARRAGAALFSAGFHAAILAAFLIGGGAETIVAAKPSPPIEVTMMPAPRPPAPPAPPSPEPPKPAKAPKPKPATTKTPVKLKARSAPPSKTVAPIAASPEVEVAAQTTELSEAALVGARTAGSGAAGGRCDMVQRLQQALRGDAVVQSAVARAGTGSGRAILLWDGDWKPTRGEQGKGLAGVREAIMVEVGFAPEACRSETMNGIVLISLNDGGTARIALGGGRWRWSELLYAPGTMARR